MTRVPVSSSNVAAVGYDADTQELEVAFKSGGVYRYHGVPAGVAAALMDANSIGSYLAGNIKGVYRHEKL